MCPRNPPAQSCHMCLLKLLAPSTRNFQAPIVDRKRNLEIAALRLTRLGARRVGLEPTEGRRMGTGQTVSGETGRQWVQKKVKVIITTHFLPMILDLPQSSSGERHRDCVLHGQE